MTSDTLPVIAIFMLPLIAFPVLLETSVCFFTCYLKIGSDIIRWQLVGAGAQVPACPERFGEGCLEPGSLVLLWRGAMSNAVDLNLNLEGSEKNIQKFAEKMLKNYPPNAPDADRQRELNDKRHLSG